MKNQQIRNLIIFICSCIFIAGIINRIDKNRKVKINHKPIKTNKKWNYQASTSQEAELIPSFHSQE